jgi:hypothetical protein
MIATKIMEYLQEKGLYAEVSEFDGKVEVDIDWGDWKHEHAYCDYLMEQIGYICVKEMVTNEDGSDCYSATHIYKKVLSYKQMLEIED